MAAALRIVIAKQLGIVRSGIFGLSKPRCVHTNDSHPQDKGKGKPEGSIGEDDIILESVNENNTNDEESNRDYGTNFTGREDPFDDQESDVKKEILTKALHFVPEYGWSPEAISAGAESIGMSAIAEGLFPRKGGDLVLHFIEDCNLRLAENLAAESRAEPDSEGEHKPRRSSGVIIRGAIEDRLRMVIPYIETWPQAMGLMLLPQNAPDAIQNVAYMVDEIWYHVGDTSTDINWYTKRGVLAGLYGATELYLVQDRSPDFERTWSFLDRRMSDIETLIRTRKTLEKASSDASKLLYAAITTARNMSGFNNRQR